MNSENGVLQEVLVVGLADLVAELGGLEVGLGDAAFLVQALQTGVFHLVVLDLEFQLVQLVAVHLGEDLALDDIVAHLHVDLADTGAGLGHDIVRGVCLDGRGIGATFAAGPPGKPGPPAGCWLPFLLPQETTARVARIGRIVLQFIC